MKKNLIIILVIATAISLTTSCSKRDESNSSGTNVSLRYKFNKGDKFKYKFTSEVSSDESVKTDTVMQVSTKQTDTYIFDFEVVDVDTDNIAELNASISSLSVNIESGDQKISFDPSKNPDQKEQQRFFQYVIQYNSPFKARINSKGEVVEISHLDKMVDKVVSMQPNQQQITAQQKTKISQDIDQGIIHPLVQLVFRELPEKSLSKDSTWEKKYPGQLSVFSVENTAKFKVEDIIKLENDNAAKVSIELNMKWEGNKTGEQNGIKYNFNDPKVSGNGSIVFNIDKGLLVKSETLTNVELVAKLEGKDNMQNTVKTTRTDFTTNKNTVELL